MNYIKIKIIVLMVMNLAFAWVPVTVVDKKKGVTRIAAMGYSTTESFL